MPPLDSTPIVVALEEHPKQDQVAIAAKALSHYSTPSLTSKVDPKP